METLKTLIETECHYRMAPDTVEMFIGLMTEVRLKNKEPLIPYGKLDNNIYIVREGLIRYAYFDGLKEKTHAFAAPGTLIVSCHSFYMRTPSVFQYESCGESVVMRVSNAACEELMRESADFTNWMFRMSMYQLYAWERKTTVINGTARERIEALIKNRPEILERGTNKVIASYIGIEQSYFSRLKKRVFVP